MTFVKVDQIPKGKTNWHDLQTLIKEFVESDAKCVKMIFSEGEYKSPRALTESLRCAVKRSKKPIKIKQRGNDVYLKKI